MDRVERLDGFHFDNDSALHDQVDSVSDFQFLTLINNWQRNFIRHFESSASEFVYKAGLIGALEESRAEERVNLHCGIHDRACDLIYRQGRGASRGSHFYSIADFPCVPL